MNISVCLTVLNEEGSIGPLLDSLLAQTKKPDQIIIVDGGSSDRTVAIIRHYQQRDGRIKLLVEKCSRARGRNLACEIAKGEIIAMTDADCVARRDWLENITVPFKNKQVDISAGFYSMVGCSSMQKAESVFLGVLPSHFDINFLPSTRSIAFRKTAWEEIGGFPDEEENSAEDTYFNFHALALGMKYARVKSAVVEWGVPASIFNFYLKIFNYAKWDAKTKIWFFPTKGLASHNIKAISVVIRYLIGLLLLILSFKLNTLPYLIILFLAYLVWSFRKIYLEFGEWQTALWGPILQITADFGVIIGFIDGLFQGYFKRG